MKKIQTMMTQSTDDFMRHTSSYDCVFFAWNLGPVEFV